MYKQFKRGAGGKNKNKNKKPWVELLMDLANLRLIRKEFFFNPVWFSKI